MAALLFISQIDDPEIWRPYFAKAFPKLEFRVWPEVGDPEEIEYALVWKQEPGALEALPNLRLVHALGAGVDQILADPAFPRAVPLVRLIEGAGMAEQMSEYCLWGVLQFHRQMGRYQSQQRDKVWKMGPPAMPQDCKVGILGLGVLGSDLAGKLAVLDYDLRGWRRSAGAVEGVTVHHGQGGFQAFLADCQILINLLPLTEETQGILCQDTFDLLPEGAYVINVGRGGHLIEEDLLEALESGQIAGALLDVFQTEPLPEAHPFWDHPKVIVTPHISTQPFDALAMEQVGANLKRAMAGKPLVGLVDPDKGY